MKKIFISYKFTGEPVEKLRKVIPLIHDALGGAGHGHYSTFSDSEQFESEAWSGKRIMEKAMKEMDSSDVILFFVNSDDESQGMILELGYAFGKGKRVVLAVNKRVGNCIFRRQIWEVIEFEDINDLCRILKNYKF